MTLVLLVLYAVVILLLLALASTTLAWMLYAWSRAGSLTDTPIQTIEIPRVGAEIERLSFSLLVPARHEELVLAATLERLVAIKHDAFEIIVIVGDDDSGTSAIASSYEQKYPNLVRVVVDYNEQKNKPRALNSALPYASGDIVGIFDAEDIVHPQLLRYVESRMIAEQCAVMQWGVQLMNYWSSWFAVRNVLEYYFWFRSRLHFQAHNGFIPLGGNTVFVRRALLERLGGWDGDCLAEDCDLGVRLSSHGFRVCVAYDPLLVTREETPSTLGAFVRQRTRWNQGFLQVLFKGDWRMLPSRRQRALARYTLFTPLIQAATGVLLPICLITFVVGNVPVGLAILSFLPLLPTLITLAVEHLALEDFGRLYGVTPRTRDHVRLFVSTLAFQIVLAYAAIRAVIRHLRRQATWEKTAHAGQHLEAANDGISAGAAAMSR